MNLQQKIERTLATAALGTLIASGAFVGYKIHERVEMLHQDKPLASTEMVQNDQEIFYGFALFDTVFVAYYAARIYQERRRGSV